MKAPILLWLFLLLAYSSVGQKIDVTPYVGANINFSSVSLSKNTVSMDSPFRPANYEAKGNGLNEQPILYGGGFYLGVINKNDFGVQSGVRYTEIVNKNISDEFLANEFIHRAEYYIYTKNLELPLHLVYDIHKSNLKDNKTEPSKFIRLFIGPVFSFAIKSQSRAFIMNEIKEESGSMATTFENTFVVSKSWQGIEAGFNINPIFKNLISLGLLFQYNISSLGHVNYNSSVAYSSKTVSVSDETTGRLRLKGNSLMLQVGIKPIILKK